MNKLFNTISAILLGTCPEILVCTLAYCFYCSAYWNNYVLGLFVLLALLALWIGFYIYSLIMKEGLLKFITHLYASPELDDLEK